MDQAEQRPPARTRRPRISFEAIARLSDVADLTLPFALRAVCRVGVADHMAAGPVGIDDLAATSGTHAPSLLRVLRALVAEGVFAEPEPGRFELTSVGDLLRSDHPLSLREAFRLDPDVDALAGLDHSIRTGEPAITRVHDEGYWAYLSANPALRTEFNASQSALSRVEAVTLLRFHDWSGLRTVVDLGGSDGTFLAALLSSHGRLRGTLFDLPAAVASAPGVLEAAGVADRCDVVAGSFFDTPLPAGADAYTIKRVMVGMDDDEVRALVGLLAKAMRRGSRLLILEPMWRDGDRISPAMDLLMLALGSGRVRMPDEYAALLGSEGMVVTGISTAGALTILEAGLAQENGEDHGS